MRIQLRRVDPDLPVPTYAHPGDAGADLVSAVDVVLDPGRRALVPTGTAIALPEGFAGFVHPRSGLAARHGVISVTLLNTDPERAFVVHRGDRIAQLVVQRVERVEFVEVEELSGTPRGDAGFGSTGGFAQQEDEGQ